jgi:signal transduction histidine kinase/ActR/RegA family two-component response regulator
MSPQVTAPLSKWFRTFLSATALWRSSSNLNETENRICAVAWFSSVSGVVATFYLVVYLWLGAAGSIVWMTGGCIVLILSPLLLIALQKFFAAKLTFLLAVSCLTLVYASAIGKNGLVEVAIVTMIGYPFIIADPNKEKLVIYTGIALPLLVFCLLYWSDYQLLPRVHAEGSTVSQYVRWSIFLVGIGFNGVMYWLFTKQRDRVLNRMFDQYYELSINKEQLLQHQEELIVLNEQLEQHRLNLEKEVSEQTQDLRESENRLKKSLADVEAARAQAEAANQAKSNFLANMSHEIRTPLNAIVGFSEIMINEVEAANVPPRFLQYLENVRMSGKNLSELINNILDLSKIEAGKFNFSKGATLTESVCKGVYQINRMKALEEGVKFTYECGKNIPKCIETDRTMLNQILMNLVSNAIKFTDKGKSVVLASDADPAAKILYLRITDQGIGIPPERQASIFEPFEQADNTITRKYGGTGLGLSITQKLVSILGGTLTLESAVGQGSTFTLSLPYQEVDGPDEEPEARPLASGNYHFTAQNSVLLVEDNKVNQLVVVALFKRLGITLHLANDGQEGIERVEELKPDLVLMDIHMPVMDGLEATRRLRQNPDYRNLPIIAMSADAFAEQQAEARAAGMNDYTTKPIEFDKLIQLLSYYLKVELTEVS